MANVKVSELVEETNLTGVQAVGVKTVSGVSTPCRYDLGNVNTKVKQALQGVITPDSQNAFSQTRNYYVGQFCSYTGGDNITRLYKFIKTHYNGTPWLGTDVVETDFWKEIESYTSNDYETVKCVVAFLEADNTASSHTVNNIPVTMTFDDGSANTNYTNSDGITTFTVKKGIHYIISTPEETGYSRPLNQEFTASISSSTESGVTYGGRVVHLNHRVGSSSTTTTVTLRLSVGGASASAYNGKTATLLYPRAATEPNSRLTAINSIINFDGTNATAVFNNVVQGEFACIYIPNLPGYCQDGDKNFVVAGDTMDVYLNVTYRSNLGIMYVCGETATTPATAAWHEFALADYPGYSEGTYDATMYPCVAVHVNSPSLGAVGGDYYVRTPDLTTQRTIANKQWCTVNELHPHVTTTYSTTSPRDANGALMTAYMMYDSDRLYGASSPAAEWAVSQTLTMNGKVLHGFIGTRVQWQVLLDAYQDVDVALKFFGYSGQNYRNFDYWLVSSTQGSNESGTYCYWGLVQLQWLSHKYNTPKVNSKNCFTFY